MNLYVERTLGSWADRTVRQAIVGVAGHRNSPGGSRRGGRGTYVLDKGM